MERNHSLRPAAVGPWSSGSIGLCRSEQRDMDGPPVVDQGRTDDLRRGESDVAAKADRGGDGGIGQGRRGTGQHAVESAGVQAAVRRLGCHAGVDRPLLVEQGGGGAGHQARPLALQRLARVEQVQAHQPVEQADGLATAAGRHREGADEVVDGGLLALVDIVERLGRRSSGDLAGGLARESFGKVRDGPEVEGPANPAAHDETSALEIEQVASR